MWRSRDIERWSQRRTRSTPLETPGRASSSLHERVDPAQDRRPVGRVRKDASQTGNRGQTQLRYNTAWRRSLEACRTSSRVSTHAASLHEVCYGRPYSRYQLTEDARVCPPDHRYEPQEVMEFVKDELPPRARGVGAVTCLMPHLVCPRDSGGRMSIVTLLRTCLIHSRRQQIEDRARCRAKI